jgi:hypothetical protein
VETSLQVAPDTTPTSVSRRSLRLPAAVIGLLLLVGLVTGIVARRNGDTSYAPTSPAGRVQRYLGLLQDGRVDAAYAMTDFGLSRNEFHSRFDAWSQQSHRVTLVQSYVHGNAATITVDISSFSAGPLGSSDSTQRMTISLVRDRSTWTIDGPTYLLY